MLNLMYITLIISIISNLLMFMAIILSKKSFFDREKLSAFECGFDQKSSSRLPFSMQFFLITIIFLIFDVEIILLLPSIINISFTKTSSWLLVNSIFIIILIIGILHEWKQGMLNWF